MYDKEPGETELWLCITSLTCNPVMVRKLKGHLFFLVPYHTDLQGTCNATRRPTLHFRVSLDQKWKKEEVKKEVKVQVVKMFSTSGSFGTLGTGIGLTLLRISFKWSRLGMQGRKGTRFINVLLLDWCLRNPTSPDERDRVTMVDNNQFSRLKSSMPFKRDSVLQNIPLSK